MAEGEVIDAEYEVRDDQGEHQEALVIIPTMAESVAKAESMTQVDVAKRYPRSVAKFKKDLETLATSSREIAGKCFYTLPARKGAESAKPISGPSIRMAEMMASSWGHLAMRCWHVATDDRSVTVAARVWDMQSNVAHQEEFVAPIVGSARYGSKRYGDDMIATTIRAAMKKALRNAILAVVPKAYYEELKSKIMQVAAGNIKDLKGSVVLAVKAWHEKFGVTEAQILKCLKRDAVDDVNAEDLIFPPRLLDGRDRGRGQGRGNLPAGDHQGPGHRRPAGQAGREAARGEAARGGGREAGGPRGAAGREEGEEVTTRPSGTPGTASG
jgi:hypothetical protein